MANFRPPGQLVTQPRDKLVLSPPYSEETLYCIGVVNSSGQRISWTLTANTARLDVRSAAGVLDNNEFALLEILCLPFEHATAVAIDRDLLTIRFANGRQNAEKQFDQAWFQSLPANLVRRKEIVIEYLPPAVASGCSSWPLVAALRLSPARIVVNSPFYQKQFFNVTMVYDGSKRIGWVAKTTNAERIEVEPPAGVLDAKESISLIVSCDAFDFRPNDTNNDRLTIEWTDPPIGATKEFDPAWFRADSIVRRKIVRIEYNH